MLILPAARDAAAPGAAAHPAPQTPCAPAEAACCKLSPTRAPTPLTAPTARSPASRQWSPGDRFSLCSPCAVRHPLACGSLPSCSSHQPVPADPQALLSLQTCCLLLRWPSPSARDRDHGKGCVFHYLPGPARIPAEIRRIGFDHVSLSIPFSPHEWISPTWTRPVAQPQTG
jgi:hypothetical protein